MMKENQDIYKDKYDTYRPLIEKALDKLYEIDSDLLLMGNSIGIEKHVGERAIVFRFGLYFQQELDKYRDFDNFNLDCEYNRDGFDVKTIRIKDRIYPDMILHQRGNNRNNLLVLEFKGWWNKSQDYDKKKILEMIDKNGQYRYKEGYTILLGKRREEANVNPVEL